MLRFSIVIPNLNSGGTLERAILSVLNQNYSNVQLIVADGGSSDNSAEILSRFSDRIDILIRNKDNGQADGINRAFRRAEGDVFAWLCADDELLPGALHHAAGLFETNPQAGVVAGGADRVFGVSFTSPAPIRPDAWHVIGLRNTLDQPSVFWRSEWHRRAGELDTSFDLAFDWEFWCRLKRAGAQLLITERTLSRYYFSRTNKTSTGGGKHVDEGYRIVRKYGSHNGLMARLYRGFYAWFDLHGCMDHPPSASKLRMLAFRAARLISLLTLGNAVAEYNWHFASLQQRGLDWWEGERRLLNDT